MMSSLFVRELLSLPVFKPAKLYQKLLALLFWGIGAAAIIAIECFIYNKVYDTFSTYKDVNRSLTVIVLGVFALGAVIVLLPRMSKSFFSVKERLILGPLPINNSAPYSAKMLLFYFEAVVFHLITSFPVSVCYCLKSNGLFAFYIIAILFSFILPLLSLGLASFLCPVFAYVSKLVKRNIWVLLIVSFLLMLGLGYLYSLVLDLFIELVVGNSINYLLTEDFVSVLRAFGAYLYPFSSYVKMSYLGGEITQFGLTLLLPVLLFLLSVPVLLPLYGRFLKVGERSRKKEKRAFAKGVTSPDKALIKKELLVLSSSNEGVLSFFSLILVSPLLIIAVIRGVETIFHTGNLNYVTTLFPGIQFFTTYGLLFLFLSVLNGSGGLSIDKEGRCFLLMKQFPIAPKKQLRIKIAVPYLWSGLSFVAAVIALAGLGDIAWSDCFLVMLSGLAYLLSLYLGYSLTSLSKKKNGAGMSILSFAFPFVLSAIPSLLTLWDGFDSLGASGPFYVLLLLNMALLIPLLIVFETRAERMFIAYEGEVLL